ESRSEVAERASGKVPQGDAAPFSEADVIAQALALSKAPFSLPEDTVPAEYKALSYNQYRAIRFKKELALWKEDNLPFATEFFSAGYIFQAPVQIYAVEGGRVSELKYSPDLFTYGPEVSRPPENSSPGFSGFRVHAAINRPDRQDEFAVFQGASYFRAKAAGQDYGLSARGLAINTAHTPADEFPMFRTFWLVKPAPNDDSVTVFALLDSVSVCGAYKFVISPGHNTLMDVACTLFPRKTIPYVGIAPLTSMFWFAPNAAQRVDEVRQRVHDSDGLLILNGIGEYIWRPLINPSRLQFSSFADKDLKGFGLIQRERNADRYQDFDACYQCRPSAWVEPIGSWGEGSVELVELPTRNEYFDNIVAFWHPKEPLQAESTYEYRYKLTWCSTPPVLQNRAAIAQTLVGQSSLHPDMRLFYVDFHGTEALHFCSEYEDFCPNSAANLELMASAGTIVNVAIRRNRISGGHRIGFEYQPAPGVAEADLRCALMKDGKQLSEVWVYRWTA
ncbi:MAG TPA: glucan biosynthesis protein, partial [Hyphomicrobiales bacterium]|nr:glucan biosynthesis protein [Hyphomicrobiales bacterium]